MGVKQISKEGAIVVAYFYLKHDVIVTRKMSIERVDDIKIQQ